jgi:hypothetical protein
VDNWNYEQNQKPHNKYKLSLELIPKTGFTPQALVSHHLARYVRSQLDSNCYLPYNFRALGEEL